MKEQMNFIVQLMNPYVQKRSMGVVFFFFFFFFKFLVLGSKVIPTPKILPERVSYHIYVEQEQIN
jgi:hypothetical protein